MKEDFQQICRGVIEIRVQFGNKIVETNYVCNPGGQNRFVDVRTPIGNYVIDCEEPNYASWLMTIMLTNGYFNASGVDYDNSNDPTWFEYCRNKTEEQKVFGEWIKRAFEEVNTDET